MSTQTMTRQAARQAVADALRGVVPDADLDACPPHARLREEYEMDSLDFLAFVENLGTSTGRRIDEDDYPRLDTLESSVEFLSSDS